MTRSEFLKDCQEALRLLSELGVGDEFAQRCEARIVEGNLGARAVTPDDPTVCGGGRVERQQDPKVVEQLARVLLRITIGLARELETFRQAVER